MSTKETPLMKQYNTIKEKYPDALLLFRVGDFYETFGEDAIKTSKILGIVLTARNNGGANVELAGFPHHSLDNYLPKLVRAGQRVAICDQLEDPKLTKKIVKRGVTELVTPGVAFNDQVLDNKSNNFLAAIHFDKKKAGVAFLDISTGEFLTAQGSLAYVDKLIQGFSPKEILYQKGKEQQFLDAFGGGFYTYKLDDWIFSETLANDTLLRHFETSSLKGFGVEHLDLGIIASGAILQYVQNNQHEKIGHITKLSRIDEEQHVWLDKFTIRNLELLYPNSQGGTALIDVLDKTNSPMGSRLLKRWIALPLKSEIKINERFDKVEFFTKNDKLTTELIQHLSKVGDIERLISKVAALRINPREIAQLGRALQQVRTIHLLFKNSKNDALKKFADAMHDCSAVLDKIEQTIFADAPVAIGKGQTIQQGIDGSLDELRDITLNSKNYLLKIQQRETEATGISSLKIAFNNVFGYYIEVRNTHKNKVPSNWIRKQTLVSAERYITEELKEYESKILGAEEKIHQLESKLFNELVLFVSDFVTQIQVNANIIAQTDCLISFAKIAKKHNYCRPKISEQTKDINITNGRHPVIEQKLPIGEHYVPNNLVLNDEQQIIMITGPNMSGKSAILRQTALIVLMAQIGSFVPAEKANIGLVDKIFTRVGASDNISSGESTFMVEMNETASILNNLSERSLILLDEIGRGTSTYDGISIAWAITEFLHEHLHRPKTLFATHYHELNDMASIFSRIKNYNVSVKEMNNKVIFLRKLVEGGSAHSFGIHVAKMAGMPTFVLDRANNVLVSLEKAHSMGEKSKKQVNGKDKIQLSFFQLDDPVLENIREQIEHIDINTLTPVEALMKLNEIKKMVGG